MELLIIPLVGTNNQAVLDPRFHRLHGYLLVITRRLGRHDIQHRLPLQEHPLSALDHPPSQGYPRSHFRAPTSRRSLAPHGRRPIYNASMRPSSRHPYRIPSRALRPEFILRLPSRASVSRHNTHVRCFRSHHVSGQRPATSSRHTITELAQSIKLLHLVFLAPGLGSERHEDCASC